MRRPRGQDPVRVPGQQTHAIADVGHPLICVVHHESPVLWPASVPRDSIKSQQALAPLISRVLIREKPASTFSRRALR